MTSSSKVTHLEILALAMSEVIRAAKHGRVLDVSEVAGRLLTTYRTSGVSPAELQLEIARLVAGEGVPVEFNAARKGVASSRRIIS